MNMFAATRESDKDIIDKRMVDKYDYFELIVYDIHSIPRGRLLNKDRFMSALDKGTGMFSGLCYNGMQDEVNESDYFGENRNYGNANLIPSLDTLVDAPKFARGKHRVGQVLCELRLFDGSLEPTTPRHVAKLQIERLASLGFKIRSVFEIEFNIMDKQGNPWGDQISFANMNAISEKQEILLDMVKDLSESGVSVDTVMCDIVPATYEVTLDISEGLKAADMTSRFKSMSRVFFQKRDLRATYISKISTLWEGNSFHFNISLWTGDGRNAFLDLDQPHHFSQFGRRWLAGLITHTPGLTALCCPTVNCYRHINQKYTPCKTNWGLQDRLACYRLVTENKDNVFLECRIPTSACNAYLVMAAVIAARMDGIEKQMSLDDVNQAAEIPRDLETALGILNNDEILVTALGKEFIDCYTHVKKKYEIDHFKSLGHISDSEMFEAEQKMYSMRC